MSVTFSKTYLERLITGGSSSSSSSSSGSSSSSSSGSSSSSSSGSTSTPSSSGFHPIAVLDSLEQSSLPLLTAFATQAVARARPLLVLCIEHSPAAWQSLLPPSPSPSAPQVALVDLTLDLPFPSSQAGQGHDWISTHVVPHLVRFLSRPPPTPRSPSSPLIILDSLTPLAQLYPSAPHFARALAALTRPTSSAQLLLPLTATPSTAHATHALTYLAPTTLHVVNAARAVRELDVIVDTPRGDLGLNPGSNAHADVVVHVASVKSPGGPAASGGGGGSKVVSECVRVTHATAAAGRMQFSVFPPPQPAPATDKVQAPAAASSTADKADPTLGLSFNLKLTDKQREAKDKVVLPHFKMQQLDEAGGGELEAVAAVGGGGGGVIHYELDLEDDFDDEDPDADLDL